MEIAAENSLNGSENYAMERQVSNSSNSVIIQRSIGKKTKNWQGRLSGCNS